MRGWRKRSAAAEVVTSSLISSCACSFVVAEPGPFREGVSVLEAVRSVVAVVPADPRGPYHRDVAVDPWEWAGRGWRQGRAGRDLAVGGRKPESSATLDWDEWGNNQK